MSCFESWLAFAWTAALFLGWPLGIAAPMGVMSEIVELAITTNSLLWISVLAVCCVAVVVTAVLIHRRQRKGLFVACTSQVAGKTLPVRTNGIGERSSPAFVSCPEPPKPAWSEPIGASAKCPDPVSFSLSPHRRDASTIWEPDVLFNLIISRFDQGDTALNQVRRSSVRWGLGIGSVKGNVRSENQDYCLGFTIGECQVLIVADGLGGLKHGRRAAFLACWAAGVSIVQSLAAGSRRFEPDPQIVAAEAMQASSLSLAAEGDKMNVQNEGLRTTLITIVANKSTIGFAYTGDGGGCVIRQTGEIVHFLEPQKAFKGVMNILSASLGPVPQGDPIYGSILRRPGDIVVAGSDGVFDRLEERFDSFPEGTNRFLRSLCDGAVAYDGDLQRVVNQTLDEMASYQDASGFICDDNLTLGLFCDGNGPKLTTTNERLTQSEPVSAPHLETAGVSLMDARG